MSQKKPNNSSNNSKNKANVKKSVYPGDGYIEKTFTLSNTFIGVVFSFLAVFVFVGIFNDDGKFIIFISDFLKGMVGYGYWFCVPSLASCAFFYLMNRNTKVTGRAVCSLLLPIVISSIISLLSVQKFRATSDVKELCVLLYEYGKVFDSGGVLGGLLSSGLENAFNIYGAMAILIVLFAFLFIFAYKISLKALFTANDSFVNNSSDEVPLTNKKTKSAKVSEESNFSKTNRMKTYDLPLDAFSEEDDDVPVVKSKEIKRKSTAILADFDENEDDIVLSPINQSKKSSAILSEKNKIPSISNPVKANKTDIIPEAVQSVKEDEVSNYVFPPVDVLNTSAKVRMDSAEDVEANKERLRNALHSFGINAEIVEIVQGPTVTRYDIELEQGVKLSRVTNLSGDIALSLGVINVRIAPIPDKISTVGIEVPNKIISTVFLRDIISSQEFSNAKSKLSFAIGKDISGTAIVGNISKLPHLLIAGTTGSGKSVCMNSLILSLLYKANPDEVRLIMIDPKMVELGVYNGIPHLYVPVVTDPKKASGALQWTVVEMLKRYSIFSEAKVRDIQSYNKLCISNGEKQMPNIVVVIDELADLMMIASKEVEESICRVAQMGRAAGMHLIIATQRPSADIITGLMKANIPSRIAFAVSSAMESRIILDQGGAEKLVGMGDMLFSPVGCGKPNRVQGAYVSDEEREEVINFIKEHSGYNSSFNSEIDDFMNKALQDKKNDSGKDDSSSSSSDSDYDEMLSKAVETIIDNPEAGCSVSMLQRRVKLGYARAARIVDQMEELGIVGPYEGAKPRKVIADRSQWENIKISIGLSSNDID